MAPSALFQTMAQKKTAGDIVDIGEHGVLFGEQTQNDLVTALYGIHV